MNHDRSTTGTLRGNFVLLGAGPLSLLLPQDAVGAASYLEEAPAPTDLPGVFTRRGDAGDEAVVALSPRLWPLPEYPAERFLLTTLHTPQGEFAFGWTDVQVMIDVELTVQPLPPPLGWEGGPLQSFVEIDGKVAFCCDPQQLAERVFAQRP